MGLYQQHTHHFAQRNSCEEEAVKEQPGTNSCKDPEEEVRIWAWFWICTRSKTFIVNIGTSTSPELVIGFTPMLYGSQLIYKAETASLGMS